MNVIIFGSPGAGKGTQSYNLSKKFNLYQVSTGALLRDEIKNKTEIGNEIEKIIAEGDFATDDIVNKLLKKIITNPLYRNRIIFDGYPRNISQAKTLDQILDKDNQSISYIFYLNVNREITEKRIIGRITCENCNKTFNEFFDKEILNNHDCGEKFLKKRKDDNKEAVMTRYDTYMKKTEPVLRFYSSKSYFHEIDGNQKIDVITGKIEQILTV